MVFILLLLRYSQKELPVSDNVTYRRKVLRINIPKDGRNGAVRS